MLLESSGRNGFLYIAMDGTLPDWPTIQHCTKGSTSVTSFLSILLGVHSLTAPFCDPVSVTKASVWLCITPNVAAHCATKLDDRRCLLLSSRRENSSADAVTLNPVFHFGSYSETDFTTTDQKSSDRLSHDGCTHTEQRCGSTAMGLNGNGRFNGTGTAVAPVTIAAAIN